MKKMFLAALTAMALSSYGYAQDEEDGEYEDVESPAESEAAPAEDSGPAAAPATAESSEPSAAVNAGTGMLGFQIDMIGAFNGDPRFYVTYKISPAMEASLILGLTLKGETSYEASGATVTKDGGTALQIGAGFDYYLTKKLLPICVGGEFIYGSLLDGDSRADAFAIATGVVPATDISMIEFNVLGGFRTEMTDNLYVTGKVGLSIDHYSWKNTDAIDGSRTDIGLKAQAMLSWFFM